MLPARVAKSGPVLSDSTPAWAAGLRPSCSTWSLGNSLAAASGPGLDAAVVWQGHGYWLRTPDGHLGRLLQELPLVRTQVLGEAQKIKTFPGWRVLLIVNL